MLHFTRHARNRMRFWSLTEAEVASVLTQPDRVTSSSHGRLNAWKQTEGYWLRITYAEEGQTLTVVTVTLRRRGPEEE